MKKRLKVPPAINQFTKTLPANQAKDLFKLLAAYRPETAEEKKKRLKAKAEAEIKDEEKAKKGAKDKDAKKGDKKEKKEAKKPLVLKFGLNHVTTLVEQQKAKLVRTRTSDHALSLACDCSRR